MSEPDPYWNVIVGCACILGTPEDDYPPSERPDYLKPFAHVKGSINSAPLDLANRMDLIYAKLKAMGWTVSVRSVDTTVHSLFGIPFPGSHEVDLLLFRSSPFSAEDAQNALNDALTSASVNYSPTAAWLGELKSEVVQPTLETAAKDAAIGVGIGASTYLLGAGAVLALGLLLTRKT